MVAAGVVAEAEVLDGPVALAVPKIMRSLPSGVAVVILFAIQKCFLISHFLQHHIPQKVSIFMSMELSLVQLT